MAKKDRFNTDATIEKYSLDVSTFDVVNVDSFKNFKFSTLFWYLYMWILALLAIILLATDIYTCLNILVFKKWGTTDGYKPFAYSIAKWIFTGCIIFQFCLLVYHWIWGIHIYRTKNIALVYLNMIAKRLYSIKSYNHFCLFNDIDEGSFFDWSCFLVYNELDNALQLLVADTPRQVINIMTLRFYATGGESNNNILANIRWIAETNLRLSIILGFMCLSLFIYAIFMIKFVFAMAMYIPIRCSLKGNEQHTIKSYCCNIVNKHVAKAVRQHHKPKHELLKKFSEDQLGDLPLFPRPDQTYNDIKKDPIIVRSESADSIPLTNLKPYTRKPPPIRNYSSSSSSYTMSKSSSGTFDAPTVLPFPLKKESLSNLRAGNESYNSQNALAQEMYGVPEQMYSTLQQQQPQPSRIDLLRRSMSQHQYLPHSNSQDQIYDCDRSNQIYGQQQNNSYSSLTRTLPQSSSQQQLYNRSNSNHNLTYNNTSHQQLNYSNSQQEIYNRSNPNQHLMYSNDDRSQEIEQTYHNLTYQENPYESSSHNSSHNHSPVYDYEKQPDQYTNNNNNNGEKEEEEAEEEFSFPVRNFEQEKSSSESLPYPVRGVSTFFEDK